MLTGESIKAGRMKVASGSKMREAFGNDSPHHLGESWALKEADIVLYGSSQVDGSISIPYPHTSSEDPIIALREDQAADLALKLMAAMSLSGEEPVTAEDVMNTLRYMRHIAGRD